jgi:hypothetical protein
MAFDMNKVVENVLQEAAEQVVRGLVGDATNSFFDMDNQLKAVVLARAKELLKTPEMEKQLKDSLSLWIQNPTKKDAPRY